MKVTRFIVAETEILAAPSPGVICEEIITGDHGIESISPLFYSHYVLHLKKAISEIICAGSGGRYSPPLFFFFFPPQSEWMHGVFPGNNAERVSGGSQDRNQIVTALS